MHKIQPHQAFSLIGIMVATTLVGCHGNSALNSPLAMSAPTQNYAAISGPQASIPVTVTSQSNASSSILFYNLAVNNISIVSASLPSGVSITYENADGSLSNQGCNITLYGQHCTLLLTANSQAAAGNYTLQVSASNAPTINVPLNLQTPSVALTPAAGATASAYTLQLTNTSQVSLSNLTIHPSSSHMLGSTSANTCVSGQTLAANASCTIATITQSEVSDGTDIALTVSGNNMSAQTVHAFSPNCTANLSNFSAETAQFPYFAGPVVNNIQVEDPTSENIAWGPSAIKPLNFDYSACASNTYWQQQRAVAAAAYWIGKKVNYCHHHVPSYGAPAAAEDHSQGSGTYSFQNQYNCSTAALITAGNTTPGATIRWNYSGSGDETQDAWTSSTSTSMSNEWHGMDCSDYTGMIYNFGMQSLLDTGVAEQAGQYPSSDSNLTYLTPNQQTAEHRLSRQPGGSPNAYSGLVCMDGTTAQDTPSSLSMCEGHGGYMSVINSEGKFSPVTNTMLSKLQTGDLLYFSIGTNYTFGKGNVIHVVMWTGKKVGYGINDINPSLIAPNEHCPSTPTPTGWVPQIGDYVITDSHYQGPDYRAFTTGCYYGDTLWGVRRVIGQQPV